MERKKEVKKIKKNLFFNFFQSHKKIATCLVIGVGFFGFFFTLNYGRYVKDIIEVYYLRSQNFYFSSDKLTIYGKNYEINPWGGTVDYDISISMSSLLNSIKGTSENINYQVTCEGDSKVDCYFGTREVRTVNRTISVDTHSDNYVVTVTPRAGVTLKTGEKVKIGVTAISSSPYKETLKATFELVIGDYGLNFEIEDEPGNIYFDALVTNTLDTTKARITLTIKDEYFEKIHFDMTNTIMQQDEFTSKTAKIGNDDYIKEVSFVLDPKSSLLVKYFKSDSTKDYSYLLGDPTLESVIEFKEEKIE